MDSVLKLEWKNKLTPKLAHIRYFHSLGIGVKGLVVNVERNDEALRNQIMEVFEKEGADTIPILFKLVQRRVALSN